MLAPFKYGVFILYSVAMGAAMGPDATEPLKSNSDVGRDPLKMEIKKKVPSLLSQV